MEKYKVFYSWQSDLSNSTNRGFIEKALENAAKAIHVDESIEIEPVIDRDTEGVPGSPDIASTIFGKIENSAVFACDVSIINKGEKSRPTPNPNVLIELGYALKTLGPERILMIMNTVFGRPEILPFDLSKKRVITYDMPKECQDRSQERKKLENKLNTALRIIFTEIEKNPSTEDTQKSLYEKCSEIIEQDKIVLWQELVERITEEIIEKLRIFKQTVEQDVSQMLTGSYNQELHKKHVCEAVNISIPGLIPILTSIQKDNEKYWRESIGFLCRLVLLNDISAGLGLNKILKIIENVLYIAGSVGMALSARKKQLKFIELWAEMKLPKKDDHGEMTWWETYEINHWQTGITGHNDNPYGFIIGLLEHDDIKSFFDRDDIFKQFLFAGNLIHSMFEFKHQASHADYEEKLKHQYWSPNVMPIWCLMEPDDFRKETWRIFGSSIEVINFAYPGTMPNAEKFWPLWQAWKKRCVQFMSDGGRYWGHLNNIYSLNLPGEPPIQT